MAVSQTFHAVRAIREAYIVWLFPLVAFLKAFSLFGVLVAALSRFPLFRKMISKRLVSPVEMILTGLLGGLLSVICTFFIFFLRPASFIPFLVGYYSGWIPGFVSGIVLGIGAAFLHVHPIIIIAASISGILGSMTATISEKFRRHSLALVASSLMMLSIAYMPGIRTGEPAIYFWPPKIFMILASRLLLFFYFCIYWISHLLEFTANQDERLAANLALAVVNKAEEAIRLLSPEMTAENLRRLASTIASVLEVPCCMALSPGTDLILSDSERYPHKLRTEVTYGAFQSLLNDGEPVIVPHTEYLACSGCSLRDLMVFPIHDGESLKAVVGLFGDSRRSFNPADRSLVRSLSILMTSNLLATKLHQKELLLQETRFRFLEAQIQPHFLFNALNTIASIVPKDPSVAEALILNLSLFLFQAFSQSENLTPLRKELEFLEAYLSIERARFGDRLQVSVEAEQSLYDRLIPPMLLQPLVENAIRHGIQPKPSGGKIRIRVVDDGGGMKFEIADDGVGFSHSSAAHPEIKGTGIGLGNVRERLLNLFGENARFSIDTIPNGGTRISFCIPR